MPRNVDAPLQVILDSGALKPALLVKVTLRGGDVYGYTSWDEPVSISGVDYLPNEGISLSQISSSIGTNVDNSEVKGSVAATRLSDADFASGVWRFATFEVLLVDMQDPSAGSTVLQSGGIGKISVADSAVTVELFGLSAKFKGSTGRLAAKDCDCWRVGDGRCRLNLAGVVADGAHVGTDVQSTRTVSAVTSNREFTFSGEPAGDEFYSLGTVEFLTGNNAGLTLEVKKHEEISGTAKITLRLLAQYDVEIGDTAKLTVGCNRKLRYEDVGETEDRIGCTCEELGNVLHHKGLHYLPGNEKVAEVARGTSE